MTIACTYAPLPEVIGCDVWTKEEMDTMTDAGKLFFFFDGEKVKLGRGINSLVTTAQGKGVSFQKIKLVDLMDMMYDDIRTTAQDHYLGKYANSYANRCLLVTAIQGYLDQLAQAERIEVLPTLVLYRDGKAVGSIVAPESKAMIEAFIQETLAE